MRGRSAVTASAPIARMTADTIAAVLITAFRREPLWHSSLRTVELAVHDHDTTVQAVQLLVAIAVTEDEATGVVVGA